MAVIRHPWIWRGSGEQNSPSPEVSGSWIVKQALHAFDADAESYNTSGTAEMKV